MTMDNTYLHSAQPPNLVSGVAIRIERLNISSKGSAPSILPAAIALLLYAKQLSLCCLFSQYRQHQASFGVENKPTHSERKEIQKQAMQLCYKGKGEKEHNS